MDVITAEGRTAPKTTAPKPAAEIDIGIEGMTCASCVRRVEKALSGVPGVVDASVNLGTERARIALADNADAAALTEAVEPPQAHRDVGVLRRERLARQAGQGLDEDAGVQAVQRRIAGRQQVACQHLRAGDAHQAVQADILPGHRPLDRERPDALARQGQQVAIRRALQQAHAHALLQRGQAPADRGLGDVQVLGGDRQGAMPGDGQEEAQVVPVQHSHP